MLKIIIQFLSSELCYSMKYNGAAGIMLVGIIWNFVIKASCIKKQKESNVRMYNVSTEHLIRVFF